MPECKRIILSKTFTILGTNTTDINQRPKTKAPNIT